MAGPGKAGSGLVTTTAPGPGSQSWRVLRHRAAGGIFGWVLLRVKPANQACLNPTRPHSLATLLPKQAVPEEQNATLLVTVGLPGPLPES